MARLNQDGGDADAGLLRARLNPLAVAGRQRIASIVAGKTVFVIGAVVLTNLLRIASTVAATRFLDAEAFGIVGIIASVSFVLHMISDVGIFSFIVRHEKAEDPAFLDEIWTLRILRSLLMAVAMIALAMPVAAFTGEAVMGPVLMVASIGFLIEGFSSLAFATAVRRGGVKRVNVMDLLTMVMQVLAVIALTGLTRSYWGLIAAGFVGNLAKTWLSYRMFPGERRRWSLSRARMAELWGFSRHIAASSILGLVIMQTDKLVFAQTLPLAMFGLYSIATSLATAPTALAAPFCSGILYPGLSDDVRQGRDLRRSFYRRRRNMLMLYAFLVGGFIASAPLVVEILYDPRYREVATFMQILSVASLMIMVTATSSEVMIACGRQVWTFYSNIGRAIWLAGGVAATYALGEPTILIWTVGTIEVPAALVYWVGLARVGAFSLRQELLTPVAAAGGLAIGWIGSAPILAWLVANN